MKTCCKHGKTTSHMWRLDCMRQQERTIQRKLRRLAVSFPWQHTWDASKRMACLVSWFQSMMDQPNCFGPMMRQNTSWWGGCEGAGCSLHDSWEGKRIVKKRNQYPIVPFRAALPNSLKPSSGLHILRIFFFYCLLIVSGWKPSLHHSVWVKYPRSQLQPTCRRNTTCWNWPKIVLKALEDGHGHLYMGSGAVWCQNRLSIKKKWQIFKRI